MNSTTNQTDFHLTFSSKNRFVKTDKDKIEIYFGNEYTMVLYGRCLVNVKKMWYYKTKGKKV